MQFRKKYSEYNFPVIFEDKFKILLTNCDIMYGGIIKLKIFLI